MPNGRTLCRFVRDDEWSKLTDSPNAPVFKGPKNKVTGKREMSNWDRTEMVLRGHSVESLRTGNLRDYPHTSHLKTEDYIQAARSAEEELREPCRISIEYTPGAVAKEQLPWAYAHVDVIEEDTSKTAQRFRELLKARARVVTLCKTCDSILPREKVNEAGFCGRCSSSGENQPKH